MLLKDHRGWDPTWSIHLSGGEGKWCAAEADRRWIWQWVHENRGLMDCPTFLSEED